MSEFLGTIIEKYPYLKKLKDIYLFILPSDFDEYKQDKNVALMDSNKEISIKLLNNILCDNKYYEYTKRLFLGSKSKFLIGAVDGNNIVDSMIFTNVEILEALSLAVSSGDVELDYNMCLRYDFLYNCISFDGFLDKFGNQFFKLEIDGKLYSFLINDLVSFLNSEEKYDDLMDLSSSKAINGVPKEYIIYAIHEFFSENNVFNNYVMPNRMKKNFDEIASFKVVDIEAMGKFIYVEDPNIKNVIVNNELKNYIMDGIPDYLTQLEKAIYIYIKMCKTLTYDGEFLVLNQKGASARKHQDINRIMSITPSDNEVVCYEFNSIYGKLLEELGINFTTFCDNGDEYGSGHSRLHFRCGKFLVRADSVTSILNGDLLRAKINEELVGLECYNANEQTRLEFESVFVKVYDLVIEEEKEKDDDIVSFNNILNYYRRVTANLGNISLEDKLDILINKVNTSKMIGVDSLSYILKLRDILFTEEERNNNLSIVIIRNNEDVVDELGAKASIIITTNSVNVSDTSTNKYYVYNPNSRLVSISNESLQENFDNGTFDYIENMEHRIPGVKKLGGVKAW